MASSLYNWRYFMCRILIAIPDPVAFSHFSLQSKIAMVGACASSMISHVAPRTQIIVNAASMPILGRVTSLNLSGISSPLPTPLSHSRLLHPRAARCFSAPAAAVASNADTSAAAAEDQDFVVINFYHLVDIERPHEVIKEHKEFLENLDVRGRIYFSEQGVNAQFGGPRKDAVAYADWVTKTQPLFEGVRYDVKMDAADGHQYPRMRIQYKPNLISLAGGMSSLPVTDPSARATPLAPSEWHRMLQHGVDGKQPLVLDVRNSYEWDAGHFVGAQRPLEDEFNETPTEALPMDVPAYLQNADPNTPVMMYCTGGIRCDVYSAYLKKKGYNNLYTLEGGVQTYMKQEGLDKWNGSLFVFDGRMAIRPNKDEEAPLEAAAPCAVCGGTAELPHANCANIDCNKLFLGCPECKTQLSGCCCESCMDAPRLLRPAKTAGQYGNWTQYVKGEDNAAQAMTTGRGEGRIARRRKRQQVLKEKEQAKRVLKVERRRHAKEAMAAVDSTNEIDAEKEAAIEAEGRMLRLRELRQRLVTGKT